MSHAWAVKNALTGLVAASFTWSTGHTATREKLNDGIYDELASSGTIAAGPTLSIDFGADKTLVGMAIINHNMRLHSAPVVTIEAADNAGYTVNLVSFGAIAVSQSRANGREHVQCFASATRRYWRLTFSGVAGIVVTMGELFAIAGPLNSPTRLKAWGHGAGFEYKQNRTVSDTGHIHATVLSGPIHSQKIPFVDMQGEIQRDEIAEISHATSGGSKPLLWIHDTTKNECIMGHISTSWNWAEKDFTLFDVDAIEITGLGREVGES